MKGYNSLDGAAGEVIRYCNCSIRYAAPCQPLRDRTLLYVRETSGYATWFTAGGAICIAHYDVINDVITRKL